MASNYSTSTESALVAAEIELINRVHARFPNNEPNKFHFFYATASPFSNFHPCTITENGLTFDSSEQYMMYYKAKLFNDDKTAQQILGAGNPGKCKALGRSVKGFDQRLWHEHRTRVVSNALYLKFTQNENLKRSLMKHHGSLFVEAAANDCIWGVGLRDNDPLIRNPANWRGLNLLGYILTDTVHRIFDESKRE